MNATADRRRATGLRRLVASPRTWMWGSVVVGAFLVALIALLVLRQQEAMELVTRRVESVQQARIDLAKGLLHVSMAGDPAAPLDPVEGAALVQQALAAFDQALTALEPAEREATAAFRRSAGALTDRLAEWQASTAPDAGLAVRLRVAYSDVEREADRLEALAQRQRLELGARLGAELAIALAVAALLLVVGGVASLGVERVSARSKAVLAENQERLSFALEATNDGLWDVQIPSGSVYLSPRGCEILGFRPDEQSRVAATWNQLVHPDDRPAALAAVDAYMEGRTPIFHLEQRLRMASGEWKWIDARGKIVARDASGAPTRMVGTHTDISDRKRGEEALRVNEERLRLALDAANLGLFDLNVQTGETIVNDQYARMLGYDPADFRETDAAWIERLHPDDREAVAAAYRDYVAGKLPQYRVEFRQRTRSGDWQWILLLGRLVERDAQGAPLRMLGTHLDITERRRAEAQLRAAVEETARLLEKEVRSRQALLSVVEDQKATEAAMRESEERFRKAVIESPFPIMLHAEDGQVLQVSRSWSEITGYAPDELTTTAAWTELAYGARRDVVLAEIDHLYDLDHRIAEGDYPIRTRSGEVRTWEFSSTPLGRVAGGRRLVMSTAADVTEHRRAAAELRGSESRYRDLIVHAPVAIFVNRDDRVALVNDACLRLFGAQREEELLGKSPFELFHPDDHARIRERIHRLRDIGEVVEPIDEHIVRLDGRVVDVEVTASPFEDQGTRAIHVVLSDITERKRAEQALQVERDRAQRYLDIAGAILVGIAPDRTIVLINKSGCALLGYSQEELLGRDWFDLVIPERERGLVQAEFARLMSGHVEPLEDVENAVVARNGEERIISWHNALLRDAAGAIVGTLSSGEDVTARKQAEAEISLLNEELEQRVVERTAELEAANKELESFSYSVSHDLRAPLRAISGFASILGRRYRDGLDEKGRHYVDTIVDSSDHMGVLIEELLGYSRLGRAMVRAEPVPLGPIVTQLRTTFGDRIAASEATLEAVEPLATPIGDPTLIERVLANLVDNALTYRRPDVAPRVTLAATRRGRTVTLAVADNGIGIAPEYRERIFEVFARLHADEQYPGTGIGLAIVRKATRLMGSDVTVESTEGIGSTFSLELPAARKLGTQP